MHWVPICAKNLQLSVTITLHMFTITILFKCRRDLLRLTFTRFSASEIIANIGVYYVPWMSIISCNPHTYSWNSSPMITHYRACHSKAHRYLSPSHAASLQENGKDSNTWQKKKIVCHDHFQRQLCWTMFTNQSNSLTNKCVLKIWTVAGWRRGFLTSARLIF